VNNDLMPSKFPLDGEIENVRISCHDPWHGQRHLRSVHVGKAERAVAEHSGEEPLPEGVGKDNVRNKTAFDIRGSFQGLLQDSRSE
jgi:hypothetical protein